MGAWARGLGLGFPGGGQDGVLVGRNQLCSGHGQQGLDYCHDCAANLFSGRGWTTFMVLSCDVRGSCAYFYTAFSSVESVIADTTLTTTVQTPAHVC